MGKIWEEFFDRIHCMDYKAKQNFRSHFLKSIFIYLNYSQIIEKLTPYCLQISTKLGKIWLLRTKILPNYFPYFVPRAQLYGSFFLLWKWAVENIDFWGISFLLWYIFIHKFYIIYFLSHFIKITYWTTFGVAYGLASKVYCLWTRGTKKKLPFV